MVAPVQLVAATGVVIVIVMAVVPALVFVVVCTPFGVCLVVQVSTALIVGVIGVLVL
jgi:hypothetical protein